ncbi:hypothetical protein [Halocalculus aciditolerans]|uniref:hypothetical protein n=1 Tax=Halocalculus aciditolerans TaxID=1383812 RepID=UPI00166DBE09|nr:hypothetical protein [Halocalculus aciditolerans]
MSSLPQASPRLVVGVLAVLAALSARSVMRRLWPETPSTPRLAHALTAQLLADARSRTRVGRWTASLTWGGALLALHYTWLAHDQYTHVPDLDILAHAMGGVGVAAILSVGLRETVPDGVSAWWIVALVLAVGAGFETYEFLVKTFWHQWTTLDYLTDTVLDLVVDALGAALVTLSGTLSTTARDGLRTP